MKYETAYLNRINGDKGAYFWKDVRSLTVHTWWRTLPKSPLVCALHVMSADRPLCALHVMSADRPGGTVVFWSKPVIVELAPPDLISNASRSPASVATRGGAAGFSLLLPQQQYPRKPSFRRYSCCLINACTHCAIDEIFTYLVNALLIARNTGIAPASHASESAARARDDLLYGAEEVLSVPMHLYFSGTSGGRRSSSRRCCDGRRGGGGIKAGRARNTGELLTWVSNTRFQMYARF
ncbi:hypothetical protein T492DRAFT_1143728 [Pavlovales sp. CCMP2436]|nr:hypothetical protein T492DRAFT_1143728 [Pavlovales sp. CCMP2436]